MLKLMYITNVPEIASIADMAGVDRIFIDLERYGKEKRQKNWDSVKSKHSISDIPKVKAAVKNAQIFVRTDPVFDGFADELESVLACRPDVVMLPYFKTVREVETFIKAVDGRVRTSILLETREAAELIDDIISVGGIDEIHIGLNDLSHSYGKKFLFEELVDGTADFAFCQSDVMAYAYNGTNLFESKVEGFSTVAALYMEQVQIVTTNPAIKTVADLAGKSVSIGAPGSGVYFNAIDVLNAYDLKESDISAVYQSFGDSAESLKDGKIDAAFIVAGAPTTAITDLATAGNVYLVSLDDSHVQSLLSASPYYTAATIKAGTY